MEFVPIFDCDRLAPMKLAMLLSVDEVPQCCQIPEEDLPTEERMKQAFIAGEDVMSSLPQP